MGLVKSVILVPALASGLWFVEAGSTTSAGHHVKPVPFQKEQNSASEPRASESVHTRGKRGPASEDSAHAAKDSARTVKQNAVLNRKLRIERILVTLDRVADVASQMNPDQAVWLEPVLVDLAEQTMELTTEDAVQQASTDDELDHIEKTVDRLVTVVDKMIEPEMSL